MKRDIDTGKVLLITKVLGGCQIGALLWFLIYYVYFSRILIWWKFTVFLALILLLMLTNSYLMIRQARQLLQTDRQNRDLRETLAQVGRLHHTLKAQRHDFLNHLQVVYGLMEMEEYSEAQKYIHHTYQDIQKVGAVLKTDIPAVNALLQAKMIAAEQRNVRVELTVTTRLAELPVPEWEFCRVMGNLIDNALEALEMQPTSDRKMEIRIYEELKYDVFRVGNNGGTIPVELREKIFEAGFTTKAGRGQGMGLAIIEEIVARHQGLLSWDSTPDWTFFEVVFPRKNLQA